MASSSPGAAPGAARGPAMPPVAGPEPGSSLGPAGPAGGPIGCPAGVGGPSAAPAAQLRSAAARGDLQEVVRLLGEGAKLLPDEEGRTALHFSASAGHADVAAALLIAGAGVNATDSAGCTALQRAAAEGHLDLVKQLIKHKADVNLQDNGPGNTALHEASWKGFSRCVQALCSVRGADLSLRNHAGFAPLHLACQNGHNQSCRELLLAGCDPDVRNNYGDTPLHTSARYGHAGVTRILVSAECKVSEQNKNGDTALHIAAAMGRRKLTRILLEAGCTKSLRNKQGETARDIATRKELTEILTILNNPVIPMPRHKDAAKESTSSNKNNNKKKRKSGRSGRGSGSRSGSRSGAGTANGVASVTANGVTNGVANGAANGPAASGGPAGAGPPRGAAGAGAGWSPYGCHYYPDTTSFPQPRLDSLPAEPLRKGEQYYLDLAGNIRKGPVGVGYTCYCAPFFRHMEQRLDRDKQDLKRHINQAVEGLERRTQGHISQLTRSLAAERARCSQRHLHLQQWLRGVGVRGAAAAEALACGGVPRARSVDSLLERPLHHADDAAGEGVAAPGVGDEMEVLSEGDNTARRKESFLRRGGRGKMPRLRPGLSWDVLAEADKVMAATDPSHTPHDPLLSVARLQSRASRARRQQLQQQQDQELQDQHDQRMRDIAANLPSHQELGVLDERVSEWRGQQRRLMLEVARASREIAELKRVTCRDRGRGLGSSGSELDSRGRDSRHSRHSRHSRNGRESRGSKGSRGSRGSRGTSRKLQTLDQVDEGEGGGRSSPSSGPGPGRSVQYLHAEVHAPPSSSTRASALNSAYRRSRSQELLRVEPVVAVSRSPTPPLLGYTSPSHSPSPTPCSPAARASRWHGVSVTAEDIENWRRLDRLRALDLEQDADPDGGGMVNNPDYEVQVEDGILFSSDLRDMRELRELRELMDLRLPPLPQPQQPTAAMRAQQSAAAEASSPSSIPTGPRGLSSAPPPAAAVLHPKPKFAAPFHPQGPHGHSTPQGPKGEVVPLPRGSVTANGNVNANASANASPAAAPVPLKRGGGSAHVPLRKSVHDMVARIQTHMLNNLMGRQGGKSKDQHAPDDAPSATPSAAAPSAAAAPASTSSSAPTGHREMAIDVGDCVQVQARRVQACHRDDDGDSESSDGEEIGAVPSPMRNGLAHGQGHGQGPDYENVSRWREERDRERDRHLVVSDLPYRSRTAVYSPDVDPDFLDVPMTKGHLMNGHGMNGHGINGHPVSGHPVSGHPVSGHLVNGHSVNGHSVNSHSVNGHSVNSHPVNVRPVKGLVNGLGVNGHDQEPKGMVNGLRDGLHSLTLGHSMAHPLSHPLGLGLGPLGHHHSPAGTPDLELEVHGHPLGHTLGHPLGHPFHHHHHYPYSGNTGSNSGSGMYSPDHGDSGYSTRLGGSSNSKGTSPSLSGLESDGLLQNATPRSAAALNMANAAAAALVHQRHTNASLV